MLGAAVWCTSCVDLNYSEVTTNNEEWVYQSPQYGIEHLVSSVYARVPNGLSKNFEGGSGATFAAACDEADCALSHDNIRKLYNGGWSPISPFSYLWENSYKAIAEANNFLEKLDKIDLSAYENNNDFQAMKNKFELFEYETRFLRAYFYFELVRAYGDVPFTLKSLTNAEANQLSRTSAITIMDWIVEEMNTIAEFLPVSYANELNTDIGRATKPMCLALKARTLLYKASPLFNTSDNKQWWLDAARATKHIEKKPLPFVRVTLLDDFYVEYERKINGQEKFYSATLDFPNKYDGAYKRRKNPSHTFKSDYFADKKCDYLRRFQIYSFKMVGGKCTIDCYVSDDDYLVLRTRSRTNEDGQLVGAHYAKIYGEITLANFFRFRSYVFNPTENDNNLEFDPDKNKTGLGCFPKPAYVR